MKSKNKPSQTAQEKRHVEKLASLPCVVCGDTGPVEILYQKTVYRRKIGAVHKPGKAYAPLPTPLS